jgi:hypothetical protein
MIYLSVKARYPSEDRVVFQVTVLVC